MTDLVKTRVLMLATDGFEQDELFKPRQALIDAGAQVTLASLTSNAITGEKGGEKGESITPDALISEVNSEDFDALVLPG
ncbi:MAG: peptidase C56, partial [Alphaproteobacteria bacterium]